jgi:POT family proton-dependent oligopeptide transporter
LNLFANKWTDRNFLGVEIPAAYFQSLNPIFVVLMSPFVSMLWTRLGSKNPFMSTKVAIGLLLTAAGFVLLWAVTPCDVVDTECGCHSVWLVPFNALVTAGEICILPVVWSAVSKLAPRQYASSLMALALFAIGAGGWVAGIVGSMVDDMGPASIFSSIAIICVVMAALMVAVTPMLRQRTHGVE